MKSSSGEHYIALDHVRALAAFMVFTWHFTHGVTGSPVPFNYAPAIFPLAMLDEGSTGVALFMTLSGYLFARLLGGKDIHYGQFVWNRVLRLLPLLLVVAFIVGLQEYLRSGAIPHYIRSLAMGLIFPTLPNGGWSITVEFHYYVALPAILWLMRRSKWFPLALVVIAIAGRGLLFVQSGEVQNAAYWTIIGRIDQFALGMLLAQFRSAMNGRYLVAVAVMLTFSAFYWLYDASGGFYKTTTSPLWIVLPTIEGAAYAVLIAWYDTSLSASKTTISKFIGLIGASSYSIYLLHVFVVFDISQFINKSIMDISNLYVACAWSLVAFLAFAPIGYLSFRFIETPFLRLRTNYLRGPLPETIILNDAQRWGNVN